MDQHFCPYCMSQVEPGEPCPVCGLTEGSYTPSPHHLPPGTILRDRYLVGRAIGEGGFGITYIGCDLRLELRVAVKEYFPTDRASRINSASLDVSRYAGAAGSRFETGKDRFLQEARTMAKMEKLPAIVSVRDFFEGNNTAYIVMEYVDGTTFKELVEQRGGQLPAGELLHTIEPLFGALSAMHELGLIHRDISPENLMLEKGEVRLLDFGCARETAAGEATLTIALKHGYAPVEQYQSKGQGPWTDVYALSATLYYCLTGRKPPQAMDRLVEDELVPPRKLGADLTEKQEQALLRGMVVTPRRRFQSVRELHTALYEGVMPPSPLEMPAPRTEAAPPKAETESQAVPEPVPAAAEDALVQMEEKRPTHREKLVLVGVVAALLLTVGLAAWHPWTNGEPPAGDSTFVYREDVFAGAVVLRENDDETALLALLEDDSVSAVTLSGCEVTVFAPLELTKPLRVEPGAALDAAQYVTVQEGGILRVEGTVQLQGLLQTSGGGTVSVGPQGTVDGLNLLRTDAEAGLSVEEGGAVRLFNGQPLDDAHRLTMTEETMLDQAVHVKSETQLLAALDQASSPIVIDEDLTIDTGDGFAQSCPVIVPEGVTVTLAENTAWCVNGSALINRGTIQGYHVQMGQWETSNPSWIVNYGTIDAGAYTEGNGGMLNYGDWRIHQCQLRDVNIVNLGELSSCGLANSPAAIRNDPEGDFYLDIVCGSLFNYGTLSAQGDGLDLGQARICLANGLRMYNTGEIVVGPYGRLENMTYLENNGGTVQVTSELGSLQNQGMIENSGTRGAMLIDSNSRDGRNEGLILACREDIETMPASLTTDCSGRAVAFSRGGSEPVRDVSDAAQLREAMNDESCGLICVPSGADITLESELTITKKLVLEGGTLTIASGDLVVSGPEGFFLGAAQVQNGSLRVENDGAALIRRLDCGGVTLTGERTLACLGGIDASVPIELKQGAALLFQDALELDSVSLQVDGMLYALNGLTLRNCPVEVTTDSNLIVRNCPFFMDGDTVLENQGFLYIYGWEWQDVELAGTVVNRGRAQLAGHTLISGTFTNYEYLSIQDSGGSPFRISGALDNRGVVVGDGKWDTGIQILTGGSAPGVPEELIEN